MLVAQSTAETRKHRQCHWRMVDMVAKRMAEHNVGAVQKTVRQARKKAEQAGLTASAELLPALAN